MSEFFFDANKCGIGNKVEKPVFKFVADCDIEPTPPPIFDCILPVIPREQEIPCPKFDVKTKFKVRRKDCTDEENELKLKITRQKSPDDCIKNECAFDVELDLSLAIPIPPCPILKTNAPKIKTIYKDTPCIEDESTFKITPRRRKPECDDPYDMGECEFEFDLTLTVPIPRPPCPKFNTKFKITTDYFKCLPPAPSKFEITPRHKAPVSCDDPGQCEFDVDLEINIPLPLPPCPKISISTFKVTPQYPVCIPVPPPCPGKNKFTVTRKFTQTNCGDLANGSGQCEFDFALEIAIPQPKIPCPTIKIKKFEVKADYKKCIIGVGGKQPQNRFEITRRIIPCKCDEPETCEFDIELEIVVPFPEPPCPNITVKSFKVIALYPTCIPPPPIKGCPTTSKFNIKRTKKDIVCGGGGGAAPQCDFDVDLEIVIPQPKIPCPELKIKKFEVKVDYVPYIQNARNRFEIVKRIIPCTCEEPERCEFDIELEIAVPIPCPPCPNIKVKDFKVNYVKYDPLKTPDPPIPSNCNTFKITKLVLGPCPPPLGSATGPTGTTGATGPCEFEIDLQICVPVPQIRCPIIKVNKFKVESKYEDCVTGQSRFVVVQNQSNTQECQFDIDLELYIPIPRIPCPEIATNLYLETFLDGCNTAGGKFDVTVETIPGSCNTPDTCIFDFTLELYIPIPRFVEDVTFNVLTPILDVSWCDPNNPGKVSELKFKFTRMPDKWLGACDHGQSVEYDVEFDLDLVIPKPPCDYILKLRPKYDEFKVNRRTDKKEYVKLFIDLLPNSDCNPCEYEFDLDIQLHCPPCPRFYPENNFTYYETENGEDPKIELRFEQRSKPDCEYPCDYDVYVDLYSPRPCKPVFKRQPTQYNPCYYTTNTDLEGCTPDPDEYLQVEIILVDPDKCEYDINVYAKPPVFEPSRKCDEFIVRRFDVKDCQYDIASSYGKLEITARTKADSDENCTYDVDLDLYLAAIKFEPGEQKIDLVQVTNLDQLEPNKYLKIWIDQPTPDCVYRINADIKIPVLLPYCTGSVKVSSSGGAEIGTGTIVCSHQNADYTIEITLDTADCTDSSSGGGGSSGLPFTAMPMTAAAPTEVQMITAPIPVVEPAGDIIKQERQYSPLMQEFIRALKTDAELRAVIKDILRV
jgi:hypothetical protein